MKIISQLLLIITSVLLIAVVTSGILSFQDIGPATPVEVAPPVLQADALIAALTTPKALNDERAPVTPKVPIPTHRLDEIPELVATRFGRFVEEASNDKERIDVDAATDYLRKRFESIRGAEYRQAFFEGLLRTSHEVLANEAVFAAAQGASAAIIMNQFYDAYENQFFAELTRETRRLDALREQREERETQATRYRVFAVLGCVPLLFFGSGWLIVRNRLRK